MRLEIETGPSVVPPAIEVFEEQDSSDSMESKSALRQGIKAAQSGNRVKARASLLRAVELDPSCENGWLWLASISEYPEELLGFLNHVLAINPANERACEWKTATHSLLSRTFVQRGADAAGDGRRDLAVECFQKALDYDERNSAAWMWMASAAESTQLKVAMLDKALECDPNNADASEAREAARNAILKERLAEAKTAAVTGKNADAVALLDALLEVSPESVEAWTMRSHLADGFDDKIRCFEKILSLDPENVAARSARDSLLSLFGALDAAIEEPVENVPEPEATMESFSNGFQADDVDLDALPETTEVDFEEFPLNGDVSEPQPLVELAPAPQLTENNYEETESLQEPSGSTEEEAASLSEDRGQPELTASQFAIAPTVEDISITEFGLVSDPQIMAEYLDDDSNQETMLEPTLLTSCPFCGMENEGQAISCGSCEAILTLSDLELLLGGEGRRNPAIIKAVEEMERRRLGNEFEPGELVTLALGHLNLRNFEMGFSCLQDASRLNPNDVVLAGQVHSLRIRLKEMKEQEEAHSHMAKGKSILVVDDSPTVRKLIAGKLEKCGHEVVCATDGVEALERLADFTPDLILLDITMPRMDGYHACKEIRHNPATATVPVVMISGKDGFFDKVRGRMAGTTGYITKPFGPETLMRAVEMYLNGEAPELDEA